MEVTHGGLLLLLVSLVEYLQKEYTMSTAYPRPYIT